jgi:hypothetical protein
MLTNSTGRALVKIYYTFGPFVADYIRDKEDLKAIVRTFLEPLVKVVEKVIIKPNKKDKSHE